MTFYDELLGDQCHQRLQRKQRGRSTLKMRSLNSYCDESAFDGGAKDPPSNILLLT